MKIKNMKKVVLSALGALAFASISAGTTFALFTSEAKTEIAATSGKINVESTLTGLKVYSAKYNESIGEYETVEQTETEVVEGLTHHLFYNTGYAAYDDSHGLLIIDRITPGDYVDFDFEIANDSNVAFKYRFSYTAVDTDSDPSTPYLDLVKGLETTIKVGEEAAKEYKGLAKYQSAWELKNDLSVLDGVSFRLGLPVEAGNKYQEKECRILIAFEAIQANAYTEDVEAVELVEEDVESQPVVAQQDQATAVTVETESGVEFSVTVPANAEYGQSEAIAQDDEIAIAVKDLGTTQEVYSTDTKMNFDLSLTVNGEEANDFAQPLEVKIKVGAGLIITGVTHNGNPVENFAYENGYITFTTSSFSPFEVEYLTGTLVDDQETLFAALANLEVERIGIKESFSLNAYIPVTQDKTIIGLGNTLTVNANRGVRVSANNVTLNMKDLTIIGGANFERGVQVDTGITNVTINMENVDVKATLYAINLCSHTTVTMNIDDCEIEGWAALNLYSDGFEINVKNSKLIGINDKSESEWNSFGTICLEGDTTGQSTDHSSNNTVTIVNSEVVTKATNNNYQIAILFNTQSYNNTVVLNNVTFTYEEVVSERTLFLLDNGTDNHLFIDGEELVEPEE